MPGYVISEIEIIDESAAKNYMKFAESAIAEYDGRYLVRGAKAEVMEGVQTDRGTIGGTIGTPFIYLYSREKKERAR